MTEVVLYHHVQGLTAGVRTFADELRQAGHTVHTPDVFDGRTFDTLEKGMAYAREAGFDALAERGVAAAEVFGSAVYAGFSFGVMMAQQLAQTRTDVFGALLMYACLPVSEFGEAWPDGVPVQVHGKQADEFFWRTSRLPARWSTRATQRSCSSIRGRSICLPTRRFRPTTPPQPRCSPSGWSRSSNRSTPAIRTERTGLRKEPAAPRVQPRRLPRDRSSGGRAPV